MNGEIVNKKKILAIITVVAIMIVGTGAAGYIFLQHNNINEISPRIATQRLNVTQTDIKSDANNLADTSAPRRYPAIVGVTYKFKDRTSIDDRVAMRDFTIPNGQADLFYLSTAYQSYFSAKEDSNDKISVLADLDSRFTEIFQQDLGSSVRWQSIAVHVGEFAQDECGDDIDIIYTLENRTITAAFFDNSALELILNDSQCPRKPEHLKDGAENDAWNKKRAFGHFCEERASCLQKYFVNPDNQKKLQSEFINLVRELQIE